MKSFLPFKVTTVQVWPLPPRSYFGVKLSHVAGVNHDAVKKETDFYKKGYIHICALLYFLYKTKTIEDQGI